MSKEEEQQYPAHLLQVWACKLLDKTGKFPYYMKKRLRWMGDSLRMYLHNMHVIQDRHCEALQALSEEVMDLISALPANILCLSTMSEGTGDEDDMGMYHDDMD